MPPSSSAAADVTGGSGRAIIAVLMLVSMVGPLSLNIVLPSLPGFPAYFQTSKDVAQLTLSLFLAGMAVSQIVVGPLADRYGRRPVLIGALTLYVVATIAAAFASAIEVLILARVLQAFGAAAGLTIGRTVVRDLYPRDRAASMIGYVTMGMVVAPMIAPALGGVLDKAFGWRSVFIASLVLGAAALTAVALILIETRPAALARSTFGDVARRSGRLLPNRDFLAYAGASSFASAMFFAFVGAAPYIVIDAMKLGQDVYGLWFAMIAGGYMVGNFLSGRFSAQVGVTRMIAVGNVLGLATGVLIALLGLLGLFSPAALFLPAVLMSVGNGMVLPNAIAGAVSVDPEAAGAASGLTGFLQLGLGAVASFLGGLVAGPSLLPIGLLMLVCALAAIAAARLSRSA
jgi:DHA1 family bicyclomycin/chloramphenicol resistance-like MFS transporter